MNYKGGETLQKWNSPGYCKCWKSNSPSTFTAAAKKSVKSDKTLRNKAEILQNLDPAQIKKVIGNNYDTSFVGSVVSKDALQR